MFNLFRYSTKSKHKKRSTSQKKPHLIKQAIPLTLALVLLVTFFNTGSISATNLAQTNAPEVVSPTSISTTDILLSVFSDGTTPFSTDSTPTGGTTYAHTPGLDDNANNNVVRSYDSVQYRVDWNVNEQDTQDVVIEIILPAALDVAWLSTDILPFSAPGCDETLSSISADGKTLSCYIGSDIPEGTSGAIFPTMEVSQVLDGTMIEINSTIDTATTDPVTSNSVSVEVSAIPNWDFKKDTAPDTYDDVTMNGVDGYVLVYPITAQPAGGSLIGNEPMNSGFDLTFYDHFYYSQLDTAAPFEPILLTSANVGTVTGYTDARVCGVYDGTGKFPTGTATLTCTDETATVGHNYPVVEMVIDANSYDAINIPATNADGSDNTTNTAIAAQIAFFVPDSEILPSGTGDAYLHNAISGDTTEITIPDTSLPEEPQTAVTPINVAGSSTVGAPDVAESTTADNANAAEFSATTESGSGGAGSSTVFRNFVSFEAGPYQARNWEDGDGSGLDFVGFDNRKTSVGGLQTNGLQNSDSAAKNYSYEGEVSRGQDFTIRMGVMTGGRSSYQEEIHGCMHIDNTYMELTEFPSFPIYTVDFTTTNLKSASNKTAETTAAAVGTPSDGIANVFWGDTYTQEGRHAYFVRENPLTKPLYVVEFGIAATGTDLNTNPRDRYQVTCLESDVNAATGWVDANDPSFDTKFTKVDDTYPDINMVRVRSLEPVEWYPETTPPIESSTSGAAFELAVQARVKTDPAYIADGATEELHVQASRASGEWDGTDAPTTPSCYYSALYDSAGDPNGDHNEYDGVTPLTNTDRHDGFCNQAFSTDLSNAGTQDPAERFVNTTTWTAHRDSISIVSSNLSFSKVNDDGVGDFVDNDDTVTFTLNVGVSGASILVEAIESIIVSDDLPSYYEFVEFVGTPSTVNNDETATDPADVGAALATPICSESDNNISCNFGSQVGDWSDQVSFTVRVKDSLANEALPNTASVTGRRAVTNSSITISKLAYAYMIPSRFEMQVSKEIERANGSCDIDNLTDGDVYDPAIAGGEWTDRCQMIDVDGDMTFSLNYTNTGNDLLEGIHVIDVLPHSTDSLEAQTTFYGTPAPTPTDDTVGDGRYPETFFTGSLAFASATGYDTIYYTTAAPATIVRDPADATNENCTSGIWTAGAPTAAATAVCFAVPDIVPGESGTITLTLDTAGNEDFDLYTNTFGAKSSSINLSNRSNDVSAMPFAEKASLGNYVWLDEDNDGVQDAGEHGIPNVVVTLTPPADIDLGNGDGVAITTVTDSNGGYLFTELPDGDGYVITIDETQDALQGEGLEYTVANNSGTSNQQDFGNQDPAGYTVDLSPSEVNLSGDFGFNYNSDSDVNTNDGLAALGSTIWIDADGDGIEDPNEIGIEGVEVTLYHDPDGDGVFDTVYGTTTTDSNGHYLFDDLPAGAYSTAVTDSSSASHDILGADYAQTGDPDHFGTTGTTNDNLSEPVVLSPGDVFLNMDYGYQPAASAGLNTIGDTIFYDADGDGDGMSQADVTGGAAVTQGTGGTADAEDYPISGVTVSLIEDTNGNGVWDAGEPIIASDTTDANGQYEFDSLPDGNYIVWVNDTDGVLNGLTQTYDPDGTLDNMSTVDLDSAGASATGVEDLDQDFGYNHGQTTTAGQIGDTIWFDIDGDGVQDEGEAGIPNVTITLTPSDEVDLGAGLGQPITTTTDANGTYLFDNLPLDETYTVTVDDTTLPAGLSQTYDADGLGTANSSTTTLTTTDPIDLDQDFGYNGDNSLGNLLWEDMDADGVYEPDGLDGIAGTDDDENLIGDVTIDVYMDTNGDGLFGPEDTLVTTVVTDSTATNTVGSDVGNYLVDGLPDGIFFVNVSDDNGIINGYWHSIGAEDTTDNSQTDAFFTVDLDSASSDTNSVQDLTADFGYYVEPGGLGNYVWFDLNNDGVADSGEPPLAGIPVTLTIDYPNGDQVVLVTETDADGLYSFDNLLIDEDFNGDGTPGVDEPTYTVTAVGFASTTSTHGSSTTDATGIGNGTDDNADDNTGEAGFPPQGSYDTTNDFGFFASRIELGDLPDSDTSMNGEDNYDTLFGGNGAAHILWPDVDGNNIPEDLAGIRAFWLGDIVDGEAEGQQGADSGGDSDGDDADGIDDEDSLVLPDSWAPSTVENIDITVSGNVSGLDINVGLWMDFNNDGDFLDAGEFGTGTATTTTANGAIFQGVASIPMTLPATYNSGLAKVYVRVRAFDGGNASTLAPLSAETILAGHTPSIDNVNGTFANGEVEDYSAIFPAVPTAVSLQDSGIAAGNSSSMLLVLAGVFSVLFITGAGLFARSRRS